MLQLLHAAAAAPAAVAACCAVATRASRGANTLAALLMLVPMVAAAVSPEPLWLVCGAVALWLSCLVTAYGVRRTADGSLARAMGWHRLSGTLAMAAVMLAMALRHAPSSAGTPASLAHSHGSAWDVGLGGTGVALVVLAGVAVHSAYVVVRMRRTAAAGGSARHAVRLDAVEMASMTTMLAVMAAALVL